MKTPKDLREATGRETTLRWRLTLTYAGIALLTALLLGGILVGMLSRYFADVDQDHLRTTADRVATAIEGSQGPSASQVLLQTAYGTNTRIQAFDASGAVVADSGSPRLIDPNTIQFPSGSGAGQSRAPRTPGGARESPADEVRSGAVFDKRAPDGSRDAVAVIRVSEGVSAGGNLMRGVVIAILVAAAAAVLAAAVMGYLISSRLTRPLAELATVSDAMAAGDLSARAQIGERDEIGRLAGSFNQMADRMQATVAALQRFASDAAHQLGTPLTALRTDLEVLRESATSPQDRRLLDRALAQEERLEDLGSGLLQLSRLESPDATREVADVPVGALLRAMQDAFASRAEQAGITLSLAVPTTEVVARADRQRLRDAVENLLDNALKFTPAEGRIELGVRPVAGWVLIWVEDDGPGIPEADRERVFERFYRARSAADIPGSGLGLAIVQAAVGVCGGTARLADSVQGTRIELWLVAAGA